MAISKIICTYSWASIVLLACLATSSNAKQTSGGLIERGKYLVKIAGCNDCHTPGYLMSAGQIPEALWLTGDRFGWRGDWGTTYATNLRLRLQGFTEEEWLAYAKSLKARPPMPWFTLNQMKEDDLKAIYQYVRHLGPAGQESMPFVPPGREPNPPFALFPPAPPAK